MNEKAQQQLGKTLWNIADQLRGAMSADDFRDYMLSFLFLRYLSDNYVEAVKKELGRDYPVETDDEARSPLQVWYDENKEDIPVFEKQMRLKVHYVIEPPFLWQHIAEMARTQDGELLNTLQAGFSYIENQSFESTFNGLFSEINLASEKLGKNYEARNKKLTKIIAEIAKGLDEFSTDRDTLGDAYEYLIGQFAAGSGKKAGEFYTPKEIERYARRVGMEEIEENDYNLNITRYVSTAEPEPVIDLEETHSKIVQADQKIREMTKEHNKYLKELGLPLLPGS
jgi:type I restriction enzyme M protein